jgi:hypothetical protein
MHSFLTILHILQAERSLLLEGYGSKLHYSIKQACRVLDKEEPSGELGARTAR